MYEKDEKQPWSNFYHRVYCSKICSAEKGVKNIIFIEKEKKFGGNSAKATSGINGAKTQMQQKQNIQDDVEKFAEVNQ